MIATVHSRPQLVRKSSNPAVQVRRHPSHLWKSSRLLIPMDQRTRRYFVCCISKKYRPPTPPRAAPGRGVYVHMRAMCDLRFRASARPLAHARFQHMRFYLPCFFGRARSVNGPFGLIAPRAQEASEAKRA